MTKKAADIMKELQGLGYVGVISNAKEDELFVISDESDKEVQLIIDLMVQIIRRRSDNKVKFKEPLEDISADFERYDRDNPSDFWGKVFKSMKEDNLEDSNALKETFETIFKYPFGCQSCEPNELKSLDDQEDLMSVASAEEFLEQYGQITVSLNDVPSTTVNDLPYF